MTEKATFDHAGCPVCLEAQNAVESIVDRSRFDLEVIHLGEAPDRLAGAEAEGLKSVPALATGGQMIHPNHGADVSALKN